VYERERGDRFLQVLTDLQKLALITASHSIKFREKLRGSLNLPKIECQLNVLEGFLCEKEQSLLHENALSV
jgi:hypothetical protein